MTCSGGVAAMPWSDSTIRVISFEDATLAQAGNQLRNGGIGTCDRGTDLIESGPWTWPS